MTDIVAQLLDEWQRLSGHSMDRGSAEAGIASNLACEAADCICDLRDKLAEAERSRALNHAVATLAIEERNALNARITAMTIWLRENQPDVFRRGIWDAFHCASTVDEVAYETDKARL